MRLALIIIKYNLQDGLQEELDLLKFKEINNQKCYFDISCKSFLRSNCLPSFGLRLKLVNIFQLYVVFKDNL